MLTAKKNSRSVIITSQENPAVKLSYPQKGQIRKGIILDNYSVHEAKGFGFYKYYFKKTTKLIFK